MSKSCLIFRLVVLIRVYLTSWQFSVFVNNASAGLDGITLKTNLSTAALISFFFNIYSFPVAEKQPDFYFI